MSVRRLSALALVLALAACSSSPGPVASADGSIARADAAGADARVDAPDTGAPLDDAAAAIDARGSGATCSFNEDCLADERCQCAGGVCACVVGVRGTGVAGVSACVSGDDCASGLCLEGPGGGLLCSAPCRVSAECPAALPRCLDVALVGRICARDPSAGADAGIADGGELPGCTGSCASTALDGVFVPNRGPFDRAQHGLTTTGDVRIEAHLGGDPACPTESSPTPDRTLILAGIAPTMAAQTEADGVRATLLDFRNILIENPLSRAQRVRVTPIAVSPGAAVAYTVEATFAEGTITGRVYAPHCASLDE
jgi:hypothetical protein